MWYDQRLDRLLFCLRSKIINAQFSALFWSHVVVQFLMRSLCDRRPKNNGMKPGSRRLSASAQHSHCIPAIAEQSIYIEEHAIQYTQVLNATAFIIIFFAYY